MKKVSKVDVKDAIAAVERVETETGVAVKTGLRAGDGTGGGKNGPIYQPLYGAPTNNT